MRVDASAGRTKGDRAARSREVRLGLVMYGGVSLAIYINGVSHEFFRAVRGRGIYRLIKALTDSDIVVDIVSGTSAGGVNGVFLAYALCNGREFGKTAKTWRDHGGIRSLLRDPLKNEPQSLLDSERYYQQTLEQAFDLMDEEPDPREDPSDISELDLFVTGTNVAGRIYTEFDDAGHAIDVKDHRALFHLKHRRGRKEPFAPKEGPAPKITERALATLSRLTSAFPAAFAPVSLPGHDADVAAALREWGDLDPASQAFFIDGGVLDNKPFTHTLREIFFRTAYRAVDRKLFYVEPDPESFADLRRQAADDGNSARRDLNVLQVALAALVGIPGYESIAEDLKALADRNNRLHQYKRLVRDLETSGPDRDVPEQTRQLYMRSRLVALSERVIEGLLKERGRRMAVAQQDRHRARQLVRWFDSAFEDISTARDVLVSFDVYFRLRRIFHVSYQLHRLLNPPPDTADARMAPLPPAIEDAYRGLLSCLNRQTKLYEIIVSAVESLLDSAPFEWRQGEFIDIWTDVQKAVATLLDGDGTAARLLRDHYSQRTPEWLPRAVLNEVNATLRRSIDQMIASIDGSSEAAAAPSGTSILSLLDHVERTLFDELPKEDPVRQSYDLFESLDAQLYPIELVSGLREKDIINIVRISPADADKGFSRRGLSDKVAGDTLYHFGAFFKRSWRSNDILWGRLDGCCQLVESLLDPERIAAVVSDRARRDALRADTALKASELFPHAGTGTNEDIDRWLTQLLSDDADDRSAALEPQTFAKKLELLIEAAQIEIVRSDIDTVMYDALYEQAEWNRYQGHAPGWFAKETFVDRFVAASAATAEMIGQMAAWSKQSNAHLPRHTDLGRFFTSTYKVGAETLTRDIPTSALMEIVATALLVLRNCLLAVFGKEAERVRAHWLHRLVLNPLLWGFYAIARRSRDRRMSRNQIIAMTGAVILIAFLLALVLGWDGVAWSIAAAVAIAVLIAIEEFRRRLGEKAGLRTYIFPMAVGAVYVLLLMLDRIVGFASWRSFGDPNIWIPAALIGIVFVYLPLLLMIPVIAAVIVFGVYQPLGLGVGWAAHAGQILTVVLVTIAAAYAAALTRARR